MEFYESVLDYYPYCKNNVRHNCAEAMLKGINAHYRLNISEDAKLQMKNFGSGMNIGGVCGLLVGAYAGLAHLEKEIGFKDNLSLKEVSIRYSQIFKEHFRTIDCCDMKPESGGCRPVVKEAAILLGDYLKEVLN